METSSFAIFTNGWLAMRPQPERTNGRERKRAEKKNFNRI
jgi:hypothetical protein